MRKRTSLRSSFHAGAVLAVGGLIGLYHLMAHIRQRPIIGTSNALNWVGKRLFRMFLKRADVDSFDIDNEVEFVGGRARRKTGAPEPSEDDFGLH